jgi:hypothetical protein
MDKARIVSAARCSIDLVIRPPRPAGYRHADRWTQATRQALAAQADHAWAVVPYRLADAESTWDQGPARSHGIGSIGPPSIANAGRPVSTRSLIEGVYGDHPPQGARRSIQTLTCGATPPTLANMQVRHHT